MELGFQDGEKSMFKSHHIVHEYLEAGAVDCPHGAYLEVPLGTPGLVIASWVHRHHPTRVDMQSNSDVSEQCQHNRELHCDKPQQCFPLVLKAHIKDFLNRSLQ